MKLSDVIASTYFTTHERAEVAVGGARMIYDVRQATIYHYASPVAYAHHVLRLTPIDRPRQRVHATALDIDPVADRTARRARFLRQPNDLDRARPAARYA